VQRLVQAILEAGYAVQLRHDPTETSWLDVSEHGKIKLLSASGKELACRMGFQHNRKLRNGGAFDSSAVEEVVAEALKALVKPASAADTAAPVLTPIEAGAGAPSA